MLNIFSVVVAVALTIGSLASGVTMIISGGLMIAIGISVIIGGIICACVIGLLLAGVSKIVKNTKITADYMYYQLLNNGVIDQYGKVKKN